MSETFESVLEFWFAPGRQEVWFVKNAQFDAEIRDRFMATYEAARDGGLTAWLGRAESMLALIIALDQFPRNMFRDDPRAFATDRQALALTKDGIGKGFDRELRGARLDFFYLPLMHSEVLADHDLLATLWRGNDSHAREHRDWIVRFGRYPQRNAALGRPSTPEEAEFLSSLKRGVDKD